MLIANELTALVVDDNDHGRVLAEQALRQVGLLNVLSAGEAIVAFDLAKKQKIDFILLDWYMSEIDGAGFVRLVRKGLTPCPKDIPIIITTAYSTRENIKRIRELGLRETLSKPFSVEQLRTAISLGVAHSLVETGSDDESVAEMKIQGDEISESDEMFEDQVLL